MKTILTIIFFLFLLNTYAQDTVKMRQIEELIFNINTSSLPVKNDTLVNDYPEMDFKTVTYLTTIIQNKKLIKYVNHVVTTRKENGVMQELITSNAFYFDNNKLIKVEELAVQDDKRLKVDWYYDKGKILYYSSKSDKAKDRAKFLLDLSKKLQETIK